MHAVKPALHLVGKRGCVGRQRIGVGHLEHGRDATHDGGAGAGFEVLLVGDSRFAEMHLAVDDARQHMQTATVDRLAGACLRQVADVHDRPVADADVAGAFAVLIEHGPAAEDEVVGLRHGCAFPSGLAP